MTQDLGVVVEVDSEQIVWELVRKKDLVLAKKTTMADFEER